MHQHILHTPLALRSTALTACADNVRPGGGFQAENLLGGHPPSKSHVTAKILPSQRTS